MLNTWPKVIVFALIIIIISTGLTLALLKVNGGGLSSSAKGIGGIQTQDSGCYESATSIPGSCQ